MRLLERLARHARDRGDSIAVRDVATGAVLTYGALAESVDEFARQLAGMFGESTTMVLKAPNTANYTIAFLAALSAGHAVFPVSNDIAEMELQTALEKSGAAATIDS